MKWFKHDSDAHMDAKMRRLIHKWGIEGYGLYWYCLELIAKGVGTTNLTFELEHDAEILAHDMRMSREKVEDMMRYMVDLKLFESSEGRITCLKLFNRVDLSQGGSKAFRDAVLAKRLEVDSHKSHDSVMAQSCIDVDVDIENKNNVVFLRERFSEFWKLFDADFGTKGSKAQAEKAFLKLSPDEDLFRLMCAAVKSQKSSKAQKRKAGEFCENFQHVERWIKNKRWEDEVSAPVTQRVYGV